MKTILQKLFFKTKNELTHHLSLPGLDHRDIAVLQKYMQIRQFGIDELIYEYRTPSAAIYYINSGSVGLFTQMDERHEDRTQYLSRGRWFGISALLENEYRTFTARALEKTELLAITKSDLAALLANEPFVGNRFLLTIIGDLHAFQAEKTAEYSKLLSKLSQSNIIV